MRAVHVSMNVCGSENIRNTKYEIRNADKFILWVVIDIDSSFVCMAFATVYKVNLFSCFCLVQKVFSLN